jgi:hypothetical protein
LDASAYAARYAAVPPTARIVVSSNWVAGETELVLRRVERHADRAAWVARSLISVRTGDFVFLQGSYITYVDMRTLVVCSAEARPRAAP